MMGGGVVAGFSQPVDKLPALILSSLEAPYQSSSSLAGNHELNVFAAGYPSSVQVACDPSQPAGPIEETVEVGGSSLTYDATSDQYRYAWKTNAAWRAAVGCSSSAWMINPSTVRCSVSSDAATGETSSDGQARAASPGAAAAGLLSCHCGPQRSAHRPASRNTLRAVANA